jgi:hypothetical protein
MRQSPGKPTGSGDITGLRPNGVKASKNHVFNHQGVKVVSAQEVFENVSAHIGGVGLAETAFFLTDGGSDCINNIRFCHENFPLVWC